jgi:putative tryptophan/tyrosine transport system substrate-binding protein
VLPFSRRQFLQHTLVLSVLALASGCGLARPEAQPALPISRIGFLSMSPPGIGHQGLRDGLASLGYREHETLTLESRSAHTNPRSVLSLARSLVRSEVDALVVADPLSTSAALQATTTIPIVLAVSDDSDQRQLPAGDDNDNLDVMPVLTDQGPNVTGVRARSGELLVTHLHLLKQTLPQLALAAVLWNLDNPRHSEQLAGLGPPAQALGIRLKPLGRRNGEGLESAFAAMARVGTGALLLVPDPLFQDLQGDLIRFAKEYRIPAIYPGRAFTDPGGLLGYGPNQGAVFRRAADFVDKILKGAKPADLPVEQPAQFDFVINLKTARMLGVTIPTSVLAQATEIIR